MSPQDPLLNIFMLTEKKIVRLKQNVSIAIQLSLLCSYKVVSYKLLLSVALILFMFRALWGIISLCSFMTCTDVLRIGNYPLIYDPEHSRGSKSKTRQYGGERILLKKKIIFSSR